MSVVKTDFLDRGRFVFLAWRYFEREKKVIVIYENN